jgi:hypothetical protein
MKLSEAIALGYPEIVPSNNVWLVPPGGIGGWTNHNNRCEGCAVGAALYAMGHRNGYYPNNVYQLLKKYWPWTMKSDCTFTRDISMNFAKVITGRMTIEELITWVKSIEPEEDPIEVTKEMPSEDRQTDYQYSGL